MVAKAVKLVVAKAVKLVVAKAVLQVVVADVIRVAGAVHVMAVEDAGHGGVKRSLSPIVLSGKRKANPSAMPCRRVMSR